MSEEKKSVQYDNALQIWDIQNQLLLEWGIDVVARSFSLSCYVEERSFHELDVKLSLLERNGDEKGRLEPITIKLNNGGGDLYTAWAMAARIKSSPCDVTVICYGHIMSAATMILAAADKKIASKYCTFMFHEASMGLQGKLGDLKNVVVQSEKEEEMYCQFLAENTKKSIVFWKNMLKSKKDVYLSALDCKKLGIVDEIF